MQKKIDSLKKLFGVVSTTYETLVSDLEDNKELTLKQLNQMNDV